MIRRHQQLAIPLFAILLGNVFASPFILSNSGNGETAAAAETSSIDIDIVPNIVNGDQAEPGEYPHFVWLGNCGATLIAPDIVLTAAHCLDKTDSEVQIGAYRRLRSDGGAQSRFCDRWIPHPRYDDFDIELGFDFALCLLDRPVEMDPNIRVELNDSPSFPSGNLQLTLIGMGRLFFPDGPLAEYLQFIEAPSHSNEQCVAIYAEVGVEANINDGHICVGDPAGGQNACYGDSGGPALWRDVRSDGTIVDTHVGVTSYAYIDTEDNQCAKPNRPLIYARTSAEIEWIRNTTCQDLGSVASFCSPDGQSPILPDLPSCGEQGKHVLDVEITSGVNATFPRPSWILKKSSTTVLERNYRMTNFTRSVVVCLDLDAFYIWSLNNLDSDSSYVLRFNGDVVASGPGGQSRTAHVIQTPEEVPPSASPTKLPTASPTKLSTASPTKGPKNKRRRKRKRKRKRKMSKN